MDQVITVAMLLGLTLVIALGLRKPTGSLVASVNWEGPAPAAPVPATRKSLTAGKGLAIVALLIGLAFSLALTGSQAQAATVACVNWNGAQQPPVVADCVNWNGAEQPPVVADAGTDCVNWNGNQQPPAAV